MAQRTQDRRLDRIAATKLFRLSRCVGEPLALDCGTEQRGECRQDPLARLPIPPVVDLQEQLPDLASAGHQLERGFALPRIRARLELDAGLRRAEHLGDADRDRRQLVLDSSVLQKRRRDIGRERHLETLPLGYRRTTPRPSRELADHHRGDQIDGERHPTAGVAQGEGVHRRQEEEVEGQQACHRDRQRVGQSPRDGEGQDGEQIEHAQTEDRRKRPQRHHGPGGERHGEQTEQDAGRVDPAAAAVKAD